MLSDGARVEVAQCTSVAQHVRSAPHSPALRVRLLFQPAPVGAVPHRLPAGAGQEPDGDPGELAR